LDARREKVTSSIVSSVSGFGKSGTVGRAALREALRARAVERQPGTRSAPSANGSVPPTGAARSAAPERGRAGDGIEIKVSAATDPPRMLVRFTEGVRYRAMLRDHLDKDMLYLRMDPGLAQPGTLYEVRLVLPGDEVVQCSGRVLAVLPSGTAILLSLDDGQRSRMRRAAQVV
jgi:hypothetical protein